MFPVVSFSLSPFKAFAMEEEIFAEVNQSLRLLGSVKNAMVMSAPSKGEGVNTEHDQQ